MTQEHLLSPIFPIFQKSQASTQDILDIVTMHVEISIVTKAASATVQNSDRLSIIIIANI